MKVIIYTLLCVIMLLSLTGCKTVDIDWNPFDDGKIGIDIDIEEMLAEEKEEN